MTVRPPRGVPHRTIHHQGIPYAGGALLQPTAGARRPPATSLSVTAAGRRLGLGRCRRLPGRLHRHSAPGRAASAPTSTITNLGDPVNGWTADLDLRRRADRHPAVERHLTQSGAQVTVTNAGYNAAIATGATATFGFNGAWTGSNPAPTSFALNGIDLHRRGDPTTGPAPAPRPRHPATDHAPADHRRRRGTSRPVRHLRRRRHAVRRRAQHHPGALRRVQRQPLPGPALVGQHDQEHRRAGRGRLRQRRGAGLVLRRHHLRHHGRLRPVRARQRPVVPGLRRGPGLAAEQPGDGDHRVADRRRQQGVLALHQPRQQLLARRPPDRRADRQPRPRACTW